jgi:rsbT co-antagonist protein RsbR
VSNESAAGRLAALLRKHDVAIVTAWVEAATTGLRGRLSAAELERDLRALFAAIVDGLDTGATDARQPAFEGARALLAELSGARARQGFTPRETCAGVFAVKDAALEAVRDDGWSGQDFPVLSRLVDDLGLHTFDVYAATREKIISDQADELLELSTPVVKLWEGVVAVPLIGTLDSARTQVVMEKLLQALVDTGSAHAIIDITGVPAVDTQVAQHLLKTVAAARLMGAECIISGIRPQIAQTIVGLGIEFGDISTKATLADALLATLRSVGAGAAARARRDA